MISDLELDRSLRAWLAPEPGERAPVDRVTAALGEIEHVSQRRSRPFVRTAFGRDDARLRRRSLFALAALLVLVLAAVLREREPAPPPVPPLQSRHFEEHALDVALPADWSLAEERCCELLRFVGPDALTTLSIDHDAPMYGVICNPECDTIEIPFFLPYSAVKQVGAFAASISELTGGDAWVPLGPAVVPS